MRSFTLFQFLFFLVGWTLPVALAQGAPPGMTIDGLFNGTPACARSCVVHGLLAAHCPLLNVDPLADCLCTDITTQSLMSTCLQESCSHADMIKAGLLQQKLCSRYPIQSREKIVKVTGIVTIVVGTLVTLARCICRYTKNRRLGLDDWLSVVATVTLIGIAVNAFFLSRMGGGLHFWTVNPANEVPLWILFWVSQHFYTLTQFFAKLSILVLYLRIFGCTRWMRLTCYGGIAVLTTHTVTIFFIMFFQCKPLEAVWNKFIDGRCLNVDAVAYAGAAISIAWDIVLILLPIPEVRKLQVSPRKRLGVALMLGIASLASVTSVIRLKFIMQLNTTHDPSWDDVEIGIWSLIEQLCVVVCGSLPALRQWLITFIPNIKFEWGTTKDQPSRVSFPPPPDPNRRVLGDMKRPPHLIAPPKRRSTLGSLFSAAMSPMSPLFSPASLQRPPSHWEEMTENLAKSQSPEKSAVERASWHSRGSSDLEMTTVRIQGAPTYDPHAQSPV